MLDVHRLRVFRSVVASGSVQAAATHLGYTPSAVSQHITQLQRETGLTLFEKVGRGIAPTAAGRLLASESDQAIDALARLDGRVRDLRDGRTTSLSISCFASAGEEWVPIVARQLLAEFPELHLAIDLNEIAPQVGHPNVDVEIITEDPAESPHAPKGYTRVELTTEPYYVVMQVGHRLADHDTVSMAELADETWVDESNPAQTCGEIQRQAVRSAGITPHFAARCQDHHTAIALADAGLGVTLVPALTLGALTAGTCAKLVTDPTPRRRIALLVRDAVSTNPAAQRTVELLQEVATQSAQMSRTQVTSRSTSS
ncbi:LysR family transcriptional regulator [Rudaeicoccus suwonensis]|uniref:DNA-binding transcriptional LysR family regulator n=1 Tax=Rudaeicoccus suwonensis TaxID=657409 RepID=A0A561E766_9MICO|nr:LysR family transcriptional regulator [Rudaeicoccus suwonensis]TWE11465.1 DNA-binding transcriptional LysR family regulator [Rudaeicoccus suwonensis]